MPIYMGFFDQPNVLSRTIRGDVTANGYEGWIELQSAQLGTNRQVTSASGRGTNRDQPSVSEIVVTKLMDSASTALFRQSTWGEGKMVVIAFVKDGTTYMTIILRDTLISSFSVSGHGGVSNAKPMESLSLNFSGITYNVQDKAPKVNEWSLQQMGEGRMLRSGM
jgi:type VI secretion system secreted protein Hcp